MSIDINGKHYNISVRDMIYIASLIFVAGFTWSLTTHRQDNLETTVKELRIEHNAVKSEQNSRTGRITILETNLNRIEGELRAFRENSTKTFQDVTEIKIELSIVKRDLNKVLELVTTASNRRTKS